MVSARKAPRTSPRKSPTQSRSQITVDAILSASGQVLVEHGYEGMTTNQVARVAGVSIGSLYRSSSFIGTMRRVARGVARETAQVTLNRVAGNAFRDQLAGLLRQAGRQVETEVYKRTPFGRRYIDIEVSMGGKVLGGIETKVGASRYKPLQQLKDWWLTNIENYPVNLARQP